MRTPARIMPRRKRAASVPAAGVRAAARAARAAAREAAVTAPRSRQRGVRAARRRARRDHKAKRRERMTEEGGQATGTKDKDYNLIWFTEQSLSNALRLTSYIEDAERDGDSEAADFFRC